MSAFVTSAAKRSGSFVTDRDTWIASGCALGAFHTFGVRGAALRSTGLQKRGTVRLVHPTPKFWKGVGWRSAEYVARDAPD